MQIGRWIDRAAVNDHPKIQMRAISKARPADRGDLFAAINGFAPLRENRRDQAEMAVHPDKSIVLDQYLETSHPTPVNPDNCTRCDRGHWAANGSGKVNSIVKRAGQRSVQQDTWTKR